MILEETRVVNWTLLSLSLSLDTNSAQEQYTIVESNKFGQYKTGKELPEEWKDRALVWEAIIVHNVPVKDVHFVCFHGI